MVRSSQFRAKLRQCDPEIRQYIATLESHNLRLQRQVGRLEANNITALNKIKALESYYGKGSPSVLNSAQRLDGDPVRAR